MHLSVTHSVTVVCCLAMMLLFVLLVHSLMMCRCLCVMLLGLVMLLCRLVMIRFLSMMWSNCMMRLLLVMLHWLMMLFFMLLVHGLVMLSPRVIRRRDRMVRLLLLVMMHRHRVIYRVSMLHSPRSMLSAPAPSRCRPSNKVSAPDCCPACASPADAASAASSQRPHRC